MADAENAETATERTADEEKPKRPARSRKSAATAAGEAKSEAGEAAPAPAPRARRSRAAAAPAAQTADAAPPAEESASADAAAAQPAPVGRTRSRRAAPKEAEQAQAAAAAPRPLPRLMGRFREEIRGQMIREFGYASPMQAPEVKKVILNVGLGEGLTNSRALETTPEHIAVITGQKPVITKASKSVAGFKVREGQSVGVMVTLRGKRMYDFLDRMISTALPRIRDFRGVPRDSFDGRGNYSLGFREQIVFPEIDYGSVDRARGFQVVIATSARTDAEGFRLLELMGMPFARPAAN